MFLLLLTPSVKDSSFLTTWSLKKKRLRFKSFNDQMKQCMYYLLDLADEGDK